MPQEKGRGMTENFCAQNWASRQEIDSAIEALSPRDMGKLLRYAAYRLWPLGRICDGSTANELFAEAIRSTLEGADGLGSGRRWNKEVDFVRYLAWAMRGIEFSWAKKRKADIAYECEAVTCDLDGDERSPLNDCASDDPNPDRSLIAEEQVERILEGFAHDGKALDVLEGLWNGMTAQEIMQNYGLTEYQYKRIRRTLSQDENARSAPIDSVMVVHR
jgi:hypothetical protein